MGNGHTDNEKPLESLVSSFQRSRYLLYSEVGCIYAVLSDSLSDDVRWKFGVYQSRAAILIESFV